MKITNVKLLGSNEVLLPTMPNFVKTSMGQQFDIADLADSEIRKIGKRWSAALLSHAAKRREIAK